MKNEKKDLTLKDLWNKALPVVFTAMVLSIGKASFDVYAFSQTKSEISKKLHEHDEEILSFGASLDKKVDKADFAKVKTKVNQIKTILCAMNNNKPSECIDN